MPAERRTFHDPLEPFIYWDASCAIARFSDTAQYHANVNAFASLDADFLRVDGIIVYTCLP